MKSTKLAKTIAAAALLIGWAPVNAVTLSLTPTPQEVALGSLVNLDVWYDTQGEDTIGGLVKITFDDSAFVIASDPVLDPTLPGTGIPPASPVTGNSFELGFAILDPFADLENGSGRIASLQFEATEIGTFAFGVDHPSTGIADAFEDPTYMGAQVQVSAVPVPAAAWLLGSALLGLVGATRRRARS